MDYSLVFENWNHFVPFCTNVMFCHSLILTHTHVLQSCGFWVYLCVFSPVWAGVDVHLNVCVWCHALCLLPWSEVYFWGDAWWFAPTGHSCCQNKSLGVCVCLFIWVSTWLVYFFYASAPINAYSACMWLWIDHFACVHADLKWKIPAVTVYIFSTKKTFRQQL